MGDLNVEKRIRELTDRLNEASKAYYAEDREVMDNFTYDRLYDELEKLENESGIRLSDSPTQKVGYEAVDVLPKIRHDSPMLSLDKTKDIEVLKNFAGNNKTILSLKMDGLTVVLTYRDGELFRAVTRGNGYEGELVTNNARVFRGMPLSIPFKGELIIRGEAYITYRDFEKINETIEDVDARYKNPRNLCSGSVRQLNNRITKERNVRLKVFGLVRAEGVDFGNSHKNEFDWLQSMGFDVVDHRIVTAEDIEEAVMEFSKEVKTNEYPSDGLVALYDDIRYGDSLGSTAKFPRNAFAFKWADETAVTHLKDIEWSPSRTGLINPIAVFDSVELEGTTVSRASIHNVSIMRELELGIGDEITVYKANMIIPQIADNLTRSGTACPPSECPVCGGPTKISSENGTQTLACVNEDCPAKAIKAFTHFVGRDAMNIEGLSESTLEKLIAKGMIKKYSDIFRLADHRDAIIDMEGFGEKSYDNLIRNIEKAKKTTLVRLLYGMGIPHIGLSGARGIVAYFNGNVEKIMNADAEELCRIDKVADIIAKEYTEWWKLAKNRENFEEILAITDIQEEDAVQEVDSIAGKTFVITGSVKHFANRSELKKVIENAGGKVTGSVTKNTDYLINNDKTSGSTKNVTAGKLGIEIITEDEFLKLKENGHAD